MIIKEGLKWGHEQLVLTSESARLDAELLLAHLLTREVTFLLAHDEQKISSINWWRYKRMISKRKEGMPVAYLIGHKEFFFLDFIVNRSVLVPRPDTEILVDCVINYFRGLRTMDYGLGRHLLLDIGTGSGCIPIAVCKNVENLNAVATDVSKKALKVAGLNIKKHGLKSRIKLVHSDLLENLPIDLLRNKEVIVTANLPYIPKDYQISPALKFEPSISLFGGEDGLSLYKKIVHPSANAQDDNFSPKNFTTLADIKPKAIFFELFEDQIAILKTKMPDYRLKFVQNMSGKARVMVMERK